MKKIDKVRAASIRRSLFVAKQAAWDLRWKLDKNLGRISKLESSSLRDAPYVDAFVAWEKVKEVEEYINKAIAGLVPKEVTQ